MGLRFFDMLMLVAESVIATVELLHTYLHLITSAPSIHTIGQETSHFSEEYMCHCSIYAVNQTVFHLLVANDAATS